MIIGLTGRNASGKGEAAEFLKSKGFAYHSLSDVIREAVKALGQELTRDNLVQAGRDLRACHGTGFLAEQIVARLQQGQNYVVDSIRHPDEVSVLRGSPGFHLVAIRSEPKVRFERMKNRGRESDPQTLEGFLELEGRETAAKEVQGQDLNATEALADTTLSNDGTLGEFHAALSGLTQRLLSRMDRPGWDEYFMKMARVASLRSNCAKRKVAAIIVRDQRVISTGYNGTPRGTRNCFDGGCPRCNQLADSGTRLEECLCSHGEENAITQAAYHGVSVKGGTLYTTFAPCLMCTKMIINAGIQQVVYNLEYPLNDTSFALLKEAGVTCRRLKVD